MFKNLYTAQGSVLMDKLNVGSEMVQSKGRVEITSPSIVNAPFYPNWNLTGKTKVESNFPKVL